MSVQFFDNRSLQLRAVFDALAPANSNPLSNQVNQLGAMLWRLDPQSAQAQQITQNIRALTAGSPEIGEKIIKVCTLGAINEIEHGLAYVMEHPQNFPELANSPGLLLTKITAVEQLFQSTLQQPSFGYNQQF